MGDNVINNFRDLIVYKKAFEQALKIFNLTKSVSKRRTIFLDGPDQTIFQINMYQYRRSLAEEALFSSFRE